MLDLISTHLHYIHCILISQNKYLNYKYSNEINLIKLKPKNYIRTLNNEVNLFIFQECVQKKFKEISL